jgi:glycosyltransferase involved in cell wall biosynthesis
MRVLHLITGLGTGGAEQQLRLLLRQLPLDCEVVTLTHPGAVARGLRADGVPVHHLGMRGNRDLAVLPRLVRLIRRGRYDLVHTHLYRACVYGRPAARLAGVPAVATEHSLGDTGIEGRPLTRGTRALYLATERLGSGTVAVSATVAARLTAWGVPAHRVQVVPNGIDAAGLRHDPAARAALRARLGVPAGTLLVAGVGRLVPGKRFDTAVRAVAALPGTVLALAGAGPERAALERLAAGLGAARRVRFLGECPMEYGTGRGGLLPAARPPLRTTGPGTGPPTVAALLSAADVFVSPSGEEAFGLAAVEALAAGLPVLHVTCPAIDDLPAHEAPSARRFGGTPEELTALLRPLAPRTAPEARNGTGVHRPPPPAVDRYDIARSADLLTEFYARALGAAPGPAPATPSPTTERAPR